jgi:hypothetical protein
VTFEGEPLSGGRVTLFGRGGAVTSAEIQPDGTFLVVRPPLGPVRASIVPLTPLSAQQAVRDSGEGATRSFKNKPVARARSEEAQRPVLPGHYADPERSNLTFIVVPGSQSHDFHLGKEGLLAERPRHADAQPRPGLRVGDLAPDIEGQDFDGRPFALRDYRGKVVVVTFWGHW